MTPEQQRIAIAEACGWRKDDHYEDGFGGSRASRLVTGWRNPNGLFLRQLPNYLSDLNAIHEAEKVLRPIQLERYHCILRERIGSYDLCIHATAAQRAEAFLRTLNLWTP